MSIDFQLIPIFVSENDTDSVIFVENVCDANIQPYNIKIEREDFECEFCDFKSIQHSQWRNHVEKQHLRKDCEVPKVQRKSNGKVFYCELCDFNSGCKGYTTKHFKEFHKVSKNLKRTNMCWLCNSENEEVKNFFFSDEGLDRHILEHHNNQNYEHVYSVCSIGFHTEYVLKIHLKANHDIEQ